MRIRSSVAKKRYFCIFSGGGGRGPGSLSRPFLIHACYLEFLSLKEDCTGSCQNDTLLEVICDDSNVVCLFVWCFTTHQPLWVISARQYLTKHDVDGKSKNLEDKNNKMMMMSLYNDN